MFNDEYDGIDSQYDNETTYSTLKFVPGNRAMADYGLDEYNGVDSEYLEA